MSGTTNTSVRSAHDEAGSELPPGLEPDDLADLRESARGASARVWPDATVAGTRAAGGAMTELWEIAAQQGWTELIGAELLPAALALQEEFGRVGAPLPLVDIFLAHSVADARGDQALAAEIAAATVRPVIAHGSIRPSGTTVRHVEAATAATHLLVVDASQGEIGWFDLAGADVTTLPGVPVPAWSEVRLASGPEWSEPLESHPNFSRERRLGLAARAAAAVTRTHELALEHARQREQFGKKIGSFQAVSHRLVNSELELVAGRELLDHAFELRAAGDPAWTVAAEIYLEFISERLAGLQFDAHHTLAASGYFEETQPPWLFRRAHADLAVLSSIGADASVGEDLVDHGATLPDWDRGESAQRIRQEVLDAFDPWLQGAPSHLHAWEDAARAVLKDRGWIGVGWPSEVGGGGWPVGDVLAFSEALAYANPPLGNILMGINSIAPMVIRLGTPELRELVLSEIRRGDLSIALGYSEPEAGSDLASLRTRADRVDGGWLVNGQKMWGTSFPDSRWVLLAARTDSEATPRHAGISLFLVDTDSAGITVSPHTSLAGDVSASTFWDDVFVPDDRLVGEVGGGWAALMAALAAERVLIGASVMRAHRAFERLVDLLATDPDAALPSRRNDVRREIGRVAVRLQAARALVNRAVRAITDGSGSLTEAPMAKIAATELAEDLNATAIRLLGPDALYEWGVDGSRGDGYFEDGLRSSIMGVIAGGTGDIQRNLVARGLGLGT